MAKVPRVVSLYYSVLRVFFWSMLLMVHNEKRLLFDKGPSTSVGLQYMLDTGTYTLNNVSVAH